MLITRLSGIWGWNLTFQAWQLVTRAVIAGGSKKKVFIEVGLLNRDKWRVVSYGKHSFSSVAFVCGAVC